MGHLVTSRVACVYVPALPLQLLLQRVDGTGPVAVRRGAEVLWANRAARRAGVQRGMRTMAARALVPNLHMEDITASELAAGTERLWRMLLHWTPGVEPVVEQPGLFWLDPNGLHMLFPSLQSWSEQVQRALAAAGFFNRVAVGFNRYLTYALVCAAHTTYVAPSPQVERSQAEVVPLKALHLDTDLRAALQPLGIATLGDFLRLSVAQVRQRLGAAAEQIHRMAHGQRWTPLQPQVEQTPLRATLSIEPADADHSRLVFAIKRLLSPLLMQSQARCHAVAVLHVHLQMTATLTHRERLQPATPTVDERTWVELLRLRLGAVQLAAPVEYIAIELETRSIAPRQLDLAIQAPRRDVDAATAALARVRAAMGERAVTRACLRDAHLPEARFVWEPLQKMSLPGLAAVSSPFSPASVCLPLMRQLLHKPQLIASPSRQEPDLWIGSAGVVRQVLGPFRLQNQWWSTAIQRDYYYAYTAQGSIAWVFHNIAQRRWFVQGWVD